MISFSTLSEPMTGQGVFIPKEIKPIKTNLYKGYLIGGTLPYFEGEKTSVTGLPVTLFSNYENSLFKPFKFIGTLTPEKDKIQVQIDSSIPIEESKIAYFRFDWKKRMSQFLNKKIKDRDSANFLSALVTGNMTDLYEKFAFLKLGLSHILAISGFHFSLLIALVASPLFFVPIRLKSLILIIIACIYFFLMGPTPSIARAFVMIVLYYLGKFSGKMTCPINNLGAACLFILLLDPSVSKSLSFQLSFLSCLGIFLYYPYFSSWINKKSGLLQKINYYYLEAIVLTFSVNLMIFPLLFFLFHKISLLGLVYNLFFPLQVLVCFALLLIALGIYPIVPMISNWMFPVINWITKIFLIPVLNPPMCLDYSIRVSFSKELTIGLTFIFFAIGIYCKIQAEKRQDDKKVLFL